MYPVTMCLTPFDVFNPDKVPEATYTSRQSDSMGDPPFDPRMYGTYEDWLSSEFKRNNGGFVIHGMTKMGKTSMVERALDGAGKSALTIEGTTIDTIEDFYSQIVTELELTQEWSVNNEKTRSNSAEAKLHSRIAYIRKELSTSEANSLTESGQKNLAKLVSGGIKLSGRPLVIDDFHHCESNLAASIGKVLKPIVRDNLVVLIAIPSQAFAPMIKAPDNVGRFRSIEVKPWGVQELQEIGLKGFPQLGYDISIEDISRRIAQEAFGSPHLMQAYSLEIARDLVGRSITPEAAFREVDENLKANLQRISSSYKPSSFGEILAGKNPRGKERTRYSIAKPPEPELQNKTFDLYEVLLLSLRHLLIVATGSNQNRNLSFTPTEVVEMTRRWQVEPTYTKKQATTAMSNSHDRAEELRDGLDPVLKLGPGSGPNGEATIDLLDPFFVSYLVHGQWVQDAGRLSLERSD